MKQKNQTTWRAHFKLMSKLYWVIAIAVLIFSTASAQFAPAAGKPGSTAIKADSNCFVNWATNCKVRRGLRQFNLADSGYASVGTDENATGPASTKGVVSLGDGGIATLSFNTSIADRPGFDFAVFENTFLDSFLELAFVEVSSDSLSWVRFPNHSLTQTKIQTPAFGFTQPTKIHNLAGKYRHPYGVPFDLADLKMMPNINLNNIRFIRIIDVIGTIDSLKCSRDWDNHPINDPWPTPFPSSGFDLDAVGVINESNLGLQEATQSNPKLFFNHETNTLILENQNTQFVTLFNGIGQVVAEKSFQGGFNQWPLELPSGIYFVQLKNSNHFIKIILTCNR